MNEKAVLKQGAVAESRGEGHPAQPHVCESRFPAPQLRPYITAYRFFDLDASVPYTVPAWTRTMMLFRYGDFFYAYFPDGTAVPHLGASLFGTTTRPLAYGGSSGRYRFVAVEFRLPAFCAAVGEGAGAFTDRVVEAGAVYGDGLMGLIVEQLCEARSVEARCAVLDRFFASRLRNREVSLKPELAEALSRLGEGRKPLTVGRLIALSEMPERTLRRRFKEITGLSPQLYQSIRRVERALGRIYHIPQAPAADIVATCGFSDQPHLIREMRRFALATPGELRRNQDAGPGPLKDFFSPG